MANYAWPTSDLFRATQCSFALEPNVRDFVSPYSGAYQGVDLLGERFRMTVSLPPVRRQEQAQRLAYFSKLRGTRTVAAWNFGHTVPEGTMRGSPLLVDQIAQGSAEALIFTTAGATLKAGDMLGIGDQLFMVAEDATAGGDGQMLVTFANRSREANGTNYVQNGTFATYSNASSTAENWAAAVAGSVSGAAWSRVTGYGGSGYATRTFCTSLGITGGTPTFVGIAQGDFAVSYGADRLLGVSAHVTGTAGTQFVFWLEAKNVSGSIIQAFSTTHSMPTTWTRLNMVLGLPVGTTQCYLYCWMQRSAGSGAAEFTVDNVRVSSGSAVTWNKPTADFRLASPVVPTTWARGVGEALQVELVEHWT